MGTLCSTKKALSLDATACYMQKVGSLRRDLRVSRGGSIRDQGIASSRRSNCRRRALRGEKLVRRARRIASTWPCGLARSRVSTSLTGTSFSPRNTRRRDSIWSAGQWLRLARVRLHIFLPSRCASRSRIAGREFRLRTVSTYMGTTIASMIGRSSENLDLHGYTMLREKNSIS